MAAPTGIPFGQYALGKRLARGGMAEVFLARQRGVEGFDRRVAVKRILPHLADSAEFIKMFLDEARYASRLSHPNIVHIYELGQAESTYFIAMEFVDGVHSGQLIRHARQEPIPPVLVARIGADAAGALAYAHRQEDADGRPLGLVHRDVSPQNIMISFDGVVKLVDFGIAKAVSSAEETQPGIVKGKYAYMSPEQTTRKALDGRSDVFSLGVVLWELLAGRNIVDRGDVVEAMKVMRDARFPRIEQQAPHVPAPLAAAVGWALSRSRDDRPNAAQLQAALEEIIKDSPVLATPLQLGEWIRPRFPRTNTTGLVPSLDESGGADGKRPGRRTNPPPAPQGTQVAQFTGEGPAAPRAVTTAAAPLAGAAAAPAVPGSAAAAAPTPATRATPPPAPRAPTNDDFTVAVAEIETSVGDGTTHLVDLGSAIAAGRRRRRPPVQAIAIGALIVAAAVAAVIASGALSADRTELAATTMLRDASSAGGDASTSVRELAVDAGSPPLMTTPDSGAVDAADDDAPTPPSAATLEIVTRPAGARAVVDRDPPRTTPVTLRDRSPGAATIVVTKDGYAPATRTVTLAAGQLRTVEIVLERRSGRGSRTGYLTARTQPYSVVFLGSRRLGETPFAAVELPVGRHILTFKHPGRRPVTRTITVRSGTTVKLNFALP